jgi:hypothetical protein
VLERVRSVVKTFAQQTLEIILNYFLLIKCFLHTKITFTNRLYQELTLKIPILVILGLYTEL